MKSLYCATKISGAPWWKVCQLHQRYLAWHTANVIYFSTGESQSLAQEKRTFHYGGCTIFMSTIYFLLNFVNLGAHNSRAFQSDPPPHGNSMFCRAKTADVYQCGAEGNFGSQGMSVHKIYCFQRVWPITISLHAKCRRRRKILQIVIKCTLN